MSTEIRLGLIRIRKKCNTANKWRRMAINTYGQDYIIWSIDMSYGQLNIWPIICFHDSEYGPTRNVTTLDKNRQVLQNNRQVASIIVALKGFSKVEIYVYIYIYIYIYTQRAP